MLSHRDVSALLGLNRSTSLWELWQFNKGNCERSRSESSRAFWGHNLRPHVLAGLQRRYDCVLAPFETRMTHGCVRVSAAKIIEPGTLPVMGATHLIVDMVSTEGYAATYGKSDNNYLATDVVHASIAHCAFNTDLVAFFLFIGNGEQESFFTLARSADADGAIAGAVDTFLDYVKRDVEPEPDYEIDFGRLSIFAADSHDKGPPLDVTEDDAFVRQAERYRRLGREKSTLDAQKRQIEKEQSILKGMLAQAMRGHSRALWGSNVIEFKPVTRNVAARVDKFVQLNLK